MIAVIDCVSVGTERGSLWGESGDKLSRVFGGAGREGKKNLKRAIRETSVCISFCLQLVKSLRG